MELPINQIVFGDCLDILSDFPDNSIDAVVTDPPYGLGKQPDIVKVMQDWIEKGYHEVRGGGFMQNKWDAFVPQPIVWKEVYRVLKPGGHVLSFFGNRTYDLGTLSMRFAGFEIRDCIYWVYATGWPKSHNISKAIDKEKGAKRKIVGKGRAGKTAFGQSSGWNKTYNPHQYDITEPSTPEAKKWDGYGTTLKPASEPIVVARKPLSEKTIVKNILKWGTGAININECMIKSNKDVKGRWPTNFIHDGSNEVKELFPFSKGQQGDVKDQTRERHSPNNCYGKMGAAVDHFRRGDKGSSARFFFCAKPSKSERNYNNKIKNNHPTLKPLTLMKHLCTMVSNPNKAIILDPYAGSGTTCIASREIKQNFIGIENNKDFFNIAKKRIEIIEEEDIFLD